MEEKSEEKISYRLQFLDSARFMASWLLNLVDNLPEWNHTINWRHGHGDKKLNECNTKIMSVVLLEYTNVEHNIIQYNCLHCKKKKQKKKNRLHCENLKMKSLININLLTISITLFFLLRRYVYLFRYMDDWEKLNKKIFTTT